MNDKQFFYANTIFNTNQRNSNENKIFKKKLIKN